MNEIEKMKYAKLYIDKLSDGINPLDDTRINENEIVLNKRINACLKYVSEIIENSIQKNEEKICKKRGTKPVYINSEQIKLLKTKDCDCKVSEIADEINKVIKENKTKKMQAVWINDWLEQKGILEKNSSGQRIPSEYGKKIGISTQLRTSAQGKYNLNLFSPQAQSFIYENIQDILLLRYGTSTFSDKLNIVDYPQEIDLIYFISKNKNKCIIAVNGSWDYISKKASYNAVLTYNGKSKFLSKSDVYTSSSNASILLGFIDAANAIKSPTDIYLLSSTPLGFNTPKSKNYKYCKEIIEILSKKNCNISIVTCHGHGNELNSFIDNIKNTSD